MRIAAEEFPRAVSVRADQGNLLPAPFFPQRQHTVILQQYQ